MYMNMSWSGERGVRHVRATRFIVIIIIIYSPSNNNTYNRAAQNWTRK